MGRGSPSQELSTDREGFRLDDGSGETTRVPASQHSYVAKGMVPVARGPEGKPGATGKLLFRNLNLTATVVRTRGSKAKITDGEGLSSTQPGTEGTQEMNQKGTKKDSHSCLGGTGLAALQPEMLSQFGDFFQL